MPTGVHDNYTGPKRTKEQRVLDKAEMVRLIRRGATKSYVASVLGVHPTQITYDWKQVIREVMKERYTDLNEIVALKLVEYAEVKAEAWWAWDRSKQVAQEEMAKEVAEQILKHLDEAKDLPDGVSAKDILANLKITVESRKGPQNQFLQTVLSCLEAERQLQGLDPIKKIDLSGKVTLDWDKLLEGKSGHNEIEAELQKIIEGELAKPQEGNGESSKPNGHLPIGFKELPENGE